MDVHVISAQISVSPPAVEASCESTEFIDTPVLVTNTGGQATTIFRFEVDEWLAVERVADCSVEELGSTLASVEFPQTLAPGEFLTVVLRSYGMSAVSGLNRKNATIVSSSGDTTFSVSLHVASSGLRVVALPDVLPQIVLRAGQATSTLITVYNSDPNSTSQWAISNCTDFVGLPVAGLPPFSFSRCGGWENNGVLGTAVPEEHLTLLQRLTFWDANKWVPYKEWKLTEAYFRQKGDIDATEMYLEANIDKDDQFWRPNGLLEVAEQAQVEIMFVAPMLVGEYTSFNTIYGASVTTWWSDPLPQSMVGHPLSFSSLAPSEWVIESSILVVPAEIDPAASTNYLERDITAGVPTKLVVEPRDSFNNAIREFGMSFTATLTRRAGEEIDGVPGDVELLFTSSYDPASGYFIMLTLPVMGPWLIATNYGDDVVPPSLFPVVLAVVCTLPGEEVISYPNARGTVCLCGEGYARTNGVCDRCAPGSEPKIDREQGCDSCTFQPGTASTDGRDCVECAIGLAPNGVADSCIPCPDNQYYDIVAQLCKACPPGQELVLGQGLPCQLCHDGSAGIDGTCDDCPDGYEPTENKQLCKSCNTGYAGVNGACEFCPPGKHQKVDQTECVDCPVGSFRNAEVRATCIRCDKADEMITKPQDGTGSTSISDCQCRVGEYDLYDDPLSGGLDPTGQYWQPVAQVIFEDVGDPVGSERLYSLFSTVSDTASMLSEEVATCTGIAVAPTCAYTSDTIGCPAGCEDDGETCGGYADAPACDLDPTTDGTGECPHGCTHIDASSKPRSWYMGVNADSIFGNPIWCFPDGRERSPQTIPANKESYEEILMRQRCISCPDCLDCGAAGDWEYNGIPFVAGPSPPSCVEEEGEKVCEPGDYPEGWTFIEDSMMDQYDVPSRYADCTKEDITANCPDPDSRESVSLPLSAAGFATNPDPYPYTKEEPGMGHFYELEEGQSALVQPVYREKKRERNVFKCNFAGACNAELTYRNATSTVERCGNGYAGPLCAFCAAGFTMKNPAEGCIFCSSGAELALAGTIWLFGMLFGFFWLLPRLNRNPRVQEFVSIIVRVVPAMMKDIKIVVQVYQIFVAMGVTLNVKFPKIVVQYMSYFKELITLDLWQMPGIGCLVGSNYYSKLYFQLAMPAGVIGFFALNYFKQAEAVDLELTNQGHVHDPEQDEKLKSKLADQHKEERKAGPLKSRPRVEEGVTDTPNPDEMSEEDAAEYLAKQEKELAKSMGTKQLGLEDDDDDEMSDHEARARFDRMERKAKLKQVAVSRSLFVLFLAYPGVTNKVFGFFMCYKTGISDQQYMFEDFAESCFADSYRIHEVICTLLMWLIPLGIPLSIGRLLNKHGDAIRQHEGPHEYEALYIDYKPDCYLWEVYIMGQKVALIGLLTFIDRGSILQSLIGLFISMFFLGGLLKYKPYAHHRSNLLSWFGQGMLVFSFMVSVLMRIDLSSEDYLNEALIGLVMLMANLPMLLYLIHDSTVTIIDELHHVRIDLLQYELGKIGSKYECIEENGVSMHKKMIRPTLAKGQEPPPPVGRIAFGEIVTVNAQAVVFQNGGAVARMHKQSDDNHGWFSYNHHGMFGKRHFKLAEEDLIEGTIVGKLHIEMRRFNERLRCNVLKIDWTERFLLDTIGEVADEDERAVEIFVEVRVNRDKKRTAATTFMDEEEDSKGPSWNQGVGQALLYDVTDPDDVDGNGLVECIVIKVFMGDPVADDAADKDDEDYKPPRYLGKVTLDLADRITQDEWEWDLFDLEAVELREDMRQLTKSEAKEKEEMENQGLTWTGPAVESTKLTKAEKEKGKSLSEELHHQAQLTKLRNGEADAAKQAAKQASKPTINPLVTLAAAQRLKSGKAKSDPTAHTGHYRAVKVTPLQAGAEISSRRTGQLKAGEVVEVTETKVLRDGTLRLKCAKRGWTSKTSAQGYAQLHRVKMQHRSTASTDESKLHLPHLHLGKGKGKSKSKDKKGGATQVSNPMFNGGDD
jgi:hypothetical protein